MFKRCMLPENVEGLAPVRINQLLYDKLSFQYKLNDQKLRGINTYFARGLGPLIAVWDKILKWEAFLLNGVKDKKFEVDMSTLQHKDLSLDFTSLRKDLDKGIILLCAGHSTVLDKRCNQLRSFFDPKYHYLLKSTNPITKELLGDNVDQKITESTKIYEAAKKLQFRNKPFSMRDYPPVQGGSRGRRFRQRGNQPFYQLEYYRPVRYEQLLSPRPHPQSQTQARGTSARRARFNTRGRPLKENQHLVY